MIGRRTLVLSVALLALLGGGRILVPYVYRKCQILSLNYQLGDAIRDLQLPRAEALIADGADVNLQRKSPLTDFYGAFSYDSPAESTLGLAARFGDAASIRRLLHRRANVNLRSSTSTTPLMLAMIAGDQAVVRVLIRAGAEVNARDMSRNSALMYPQFGGIHFSYGKRQYDSAEAVNVLLAAGADPNLENSSGETALSLAEQAGERNQVAALRRVGARGLREELAGLPGADLLFAVRTQDMGAVKRLIRRGARVAVQDKHSKSPLMYAATQYDGQLIHYLTRHAPDLKQSLELRDSDGNTALYHALSFDYSFQKLLQAGADPYNTNTRGGDIFRMTSPEQQQLLRQRGVKPLY